MRYWIVAAALLLSPWAARAERGLPSDWTYQGQLVDAEGVPATGHADVELRLLASDGAPLYAEQHERVPVWDGLFALRLGDGEPLFDILADVAREAGYVEVWVAGERLGPPEPLVPPTAERGLAADPPSPGLRVYDRYGDVLGLYAGERILGGEQYFVHRPDTGLTLALRGFTGELGVAELEVFHETEDCRGQGFVDRRLSGVVFAETEAGFLVGTATQALRPLTARAVQAADGSCRREVRELAGVVPVTAIEAIPLELPAAAPLHVGILGD